jgi:hypothetical protein
MTSWLRRLLIVPLLPAALFACTACQKSTDAGQGGTTPQGGEAAPAPRQPTPIRGIMTKLNGGRQPLKATINAELKKDPPAWDKIKSQTSAAAKMAASLSEYTPPKGSPESWKKLSAAYAASASALDKAAQAEDKKAAEAAWTTLFSNTACIECHNQHRGEVRLRGKEI